MTTRTIKVDLAGRAYNIAIGPGLIDRLGELARPLLARPKVVIVTDETVAPLYGTRTFHAFKNAGIDAGAKANHLAYLGDGEIGEGANVGAGTIFCNYDGFQKHLTVIGPGAFIGSDSQIVAPVRIGKDAYVATGTTVTKDVPDEALAIARVAQENKPGYAPRLKARLAAAAAKKKP